MKKKLIASALGLVLVFGIAGTGVSRVSAEPETENILTESVEEAYEQEEESSNTESETADHEEEAEASETEAGELSPEEEESAEDPASDSAEEEEAAEEEEEVTGMVFCLENTLETSVTSVEVSTFDGTEYSENLLLNDRVLESGGTVTLGIPEKFQDSDLGMYNIRILTEDGSSMEIPFVPLLEEVTGTIYREADAVLIRVRDDRLEAEKEKSSASEIIQTEETVSETMSEILAQELE